MDQDSIALQYHYIRTNNNPLGSKHLLDQAEDQSSYSRFHGRVHPIIRNYLEKFGYYDIFLVDSETGNIVYSVYKELDYSTSLINGPYAQTNFGEAFRQANAANNKDTVVLVDYAQYTPSYEAPASFIASPIFDGNKKIGVALFQMPIDQLNQIMGERAGFGKTGETYLVGPDRLMRSDSYLDSKHHSVVASFKHPETGKVETEALENALSGKTGAHVITDYNGNPVLSAYVPVKIGNFTWALLAEIDVAEAFVPHVSGEEKDFFTKYKEAYGYYDLFLINPDGQAFYTVEKESDYQTNLVYGKYKDSNLGQLVRQVLDSKTFKIADFAPYAPSNNEPAAFIAQPVVNEGKVEIVVALQLSLEAINQIMQQREGMGKTGETYLVGSDQLMRSDSFLDPEGHSVVASFANPARGNVDTEASREALSGKTDTKTIIDYNGNPVLSAFTPLQIGGFNWALIAEMDVAEAEEAPDALAALIYKFGGGVLIFVVLVIFAVLTIVRSLTGAIKVQVNKLYNSAVQLTSASQQISESSQQLSQGATEQAASLEETSSSLEEIASQTKENADNADNASTAVETVAQIIKQSADNAQEAANLSQSARHSAEGGSKAMEDITTAMKEIRQGSEQITDIIEVINDITHQTKMLATNAAIEAARAGDHGKGFAVVADEVSKLAENSKSAAKEIATLIKDSVRKAQAGSELAEKGEGMLKEILNKSINVAELVNQISTAAVEQTQKTAVAEQLVENIKNASNEQANGVDQVTRAVVEMDTVTQSNAATSEEAAAASEELSAQAESLQEIVIELSKHVGIKNSGNTAAQDKGTQRVKAPGFQFESKIEETPVLPLDKVKNPVATFNNMPRLVKPSKTIPMRDDFQEF